MNNPKEGALRVWHCPQIPCTPFHVEVDSPAQAKRLIRALADYDLFQLEHDIKPDYCNGSGLEVFENGEWCEWIDPETDQEIEDWEEPAAA